MSDFTLRTNRSAADASSAADVRGRRASAEPLKNASPRTKPAPAATKEQIRAVVEQIDSYLKASRRELQFHVDEDSGEVIVRVRDPATGEVIRQIPGEEVLKMARALHEKTPVLLDLVV